MTPRLFLDISTTMEKTDRSLIGNALSLGELVRVTRKGMRLPIDQAAMLCGVSVQFLHDLEKGKPTIQFDKAVHVARTLGISLYATKRSLEGMHDDAGR